MNRTRKIARAQVRQTMLRTTLPQDIAWGVTVADDGAAIVSWEPDRAPVPVTDVPALTALFRGMFFPADYTDARSALDAHNALMAA